MQDQSHCWCNTHNLPSEPNVMSFSGIQNGHGPGIIEWLENIDEGKGLLMQAYGEAIKERFDFVAEILDVYAETVGCVSGKFFQDFGVTKLGHKRLFEKWFREVGPQCGANAWGLGLNKEV